MKAEAFKTVLEWVKSILIQIILILRSFTSSIDSYPQNIVDKPKPSKAKDFKVFVFFTVLTALTTRYLLSVFKRKVMGDGPFSKELIYLSFSGLKPAYFPFDFGWKITPAKPKKWP